MTFKTLSDYYWKLPKIISIPLIIVMSIAIAIAIYICIYGYPYQFLIYTCIVTALLTAYAIFLNRPFLQYLLNGIKSEPDTYIGMLILCLIACLIMTCIVGFPAAFVMVLLIMILLGLYIFLGSVYDEIPVIQNFIILFPIVIFHSFIFGIVITHAIGFSANEKGFMTRLLKTEASIESDYQHAIHNLDTQVLTKQNVIDSYALKYIDHYNEKIRSKAIDLLSPFSNLDEIQEPLQTVSESLFEKDYIRNKAFCAVVSHSSSHYIGFSDFIDNALWYEKFIPQTQVGFSCLPDNLSAKNQSRVISTYLLYLGKNKHQYQVYTTKIIKKDSQLRHKWADEIGYDGLAKVFKFGFSRDHIKKRIRVLSNRDIILGDAYVENAFLKLMRSDDEDDISDAFDAMENAYNYHPEVEKILVNHLHSSDDDVVSRAKKLLLNYRITDWNSITAVLKIIDSGSAYDKEGAFKLLTRSLPVYVKELETTISEQKQNIIKNVREKATRQCQHDMDADVRQAACQTLEVIE